LARQVISTDFAERSEVPVDFARRIRRVWLASQTVACRMWANPTRSVCANESATPSFRNTQTVESQVLKLVMTDLL
jgi:hypothetical protein